MSEIPAPLTIPYEYMVFDLGGYHCCTILSEQSMAEIYKEPPGCLCATFNGITGGPTLQLSVIQKENEPIIVIGDNNFPDRLDEKLTNFPSTRENFPENCPKEFDYETIKRKIQPFDDMVDWGWRGSITKAAEEYLRSKGFVYVPEDSRYNLIEKGEK